MAARFKSVTMNVFQQIRNTYFIYLQKFPLQTKSNIQPYHEYNCMSTILSVACARDTKAVAYCSTSSDMKPHTMHTHVYVCKEC